MDGATLRLLNELQEVAEGGHPTVGALDAFARLLAGRAQETSESGWTWDVAARSIKLCGEGRAAPYRHIYETVLTRGYQIDLTEHPRRWDALALEGLLSLPLRERAALATTCLLGFTSEELGHVLGTSASHARAIVDGAVALIRREAGLDRGARAPRKRTEPAA